jgi:hypothetical protein
VTRASRRVVLIVEDGTEYRDAFRRLSPEGADGSVEWLHAPNASAARHLLDEHRVDAVFLDVVFDRTPPGDLIGSGDRASLAARQGFYVAAALAPAIPPGVPVLLAYDFTDDPGRLAALRRTIPALEGVQEGESASRLVERLLGKP